MMHNKGTIDSKRYIKQDMRIVGLSIMKQKGYPGDQTRWEKLCARLNPFDFPPLLWYQKWWRKRYYQRCHTDKRLAEAFQATYLIPAPRRGKQPKALDIGCGQGRISALLKQLGYDVYGLDVAHGNYWNSDKFVIGSCEKMPFSDESFDLCTCFGVLGLVYDEAQAMREIYRVLKKDGTLVIQVTSRNSFYTRLRGKMIFHEHYREYIPEEVQTLLKDAGFKVKKASSDSIYLPFFKRFYAALSYMMFPQKLNQWISSITPSKYHALINVVAIKEEDEHNP